MADGDGGLKAPVYVRSKLAVELVDGRHVECLTYVVDGTNRQGFAGDLPLETQAQIISVSAGC